MTKHTLIVALALACSSCAFEPPPTDELSQPALVSEMIFTNMIFTNALLTSDVLTHPSALSTPLASHKNVTALRVGDDGEKNAMRYLVECALPDGECVQIRDTAGSLTTMCGKIGLASEWQYGGCGPNCQEWVSACLLARANELGIKQRIALVQAYEDDGPLSYPSQKVKNTFTVPAATLYGNVFSTASPRPMYAAIPLRADYPDVPDYAWTDRFCNGPGLSKDCDIIIGGYMSASSPACGSYHHVCLGESANGVPTTCYGGDLCVRPAYQWTSWPNVILAYAPEQSCAHSETKIGGALPAGCSPCAWKVGKELGYSSCNTTFWNGTCVTKARLYCSDHSLCNIGPPLTVGDLACVDEVCAARPSCCKSTGSWDATCVTTANQLCDDLDCPLGP